MIEQVSPKIRWLLIVEISNRRPITHLKIESFDEDCSDFNVLVDQVACICFYADESLLVANFRTN